NVGDGESQPCLLNNFQRQAAVLKCDIVNTHPQHHTEAHDDRVDQTFPLVLRHCYISPFSIKKIQDQAEEHSTKSCCPSSCRDYYNKSKVPLVIVSVSKIFSPQLSASG